MGGLRRALADFGKFWWDFIVGDDWRLAVGVVAALAVTAGLAALDIPSWWFLPVAVLAVLVISVRHDTRRTNAR